MIRVKEHAGQRWKLQLAKRFSADPQATKQRIKKRYNKQEKEGRRCVPSGMGRESRGEESKTQQGDRGNMRARTLARQVVGVGEGPIRCNPEKRKTARMREREAGIVSKERHCHVVKAMELAPPRINVGVEVTFRTQWKISDARFKLLRP